MSFGLISHVLFSLDALESPCMQSIIFDYMKTGKTPFVSAWFENATVFHFNDLYAFSRPIYIPCFHFPISYQFLYCCNENGVETFVPSNACLTKIDCELLFVSILQFKLPPPNSYFTLIFTTTYCSQSDREIILCACIWLPHAMKNA